MKSLHQMKSKSKQLHKIWPVSQLIHLSYLSQNMYIKHQSMICTFIVVQTILEVGIPMISIIPITNSYLSNIQPFCRLLSYEFTKWLGKLSLVFVLTELFLFLLCTFMIICLLKSKNQAILKYSLNALIFIYMISALLLFMQTQELVQCFTNSNSQLTSTQSAQNTIISILSIINIILILSLTVIYNLVCHSYSTTILNHLCKKFCLKSCIIDLIYRIMLTVLPYLLNMLKNPQNNEFVAQMCIIYTSICLALNIFKQYNEIRYFTYLSKTTGKIYRFCITFEFSLIFITLICLISNQILIISNSFFVILSLWVFLYKTLYYYLANREQHYQLLELEEINNPRDAEMYIWQLNKLFSQGGDKQSLILSNIKKIHEQTCEDASCICKQLAKGQQKNEENGIQRQNTNVRIVKKHMKVLTSVEIMVNYQRMLIIDILEKISEKYPEDMDVVLLISYIKLKVYSVFGDTIWKLNKLGRNSGSSLNNIGCKEIYNKIFVEKFIINLKNMIRARNAQQQISQTQQCLESDELVHQMIKKYQRIIELKMQFWKFFSKGVVVHHYFQKVINEQIQMMKQFHKFNGYLIEKFKNSYLLVSLLIGYEKFILFKEKLSKDLNQIAKLSKLTHSHENIFKIQKNKGQKQSVQRWILSSMCCTFEALINFQQLGTVISTSKNIQTVFGYKPQMVNGFNINKLMPTSMQEQHDHILHSWAKKCSWTNLGKIRNIFCIDRNNVSFSSGVYLKFIQRQSSINIIASIFKENDQDYMIVDHNGIIVGAGSRFFDLLGRVLVGLPLKFVCTQSRNIKRWALQNNRIRHRTIFFSIKQHSQLLQKFIQNKYSIDGQINQQIKEGFNRDQSTHGHVVQVEVYPYHIGRIFFSVIKIQSIISENLALTYRNPTLNGSQTNLYSFQQKQYYSKAEIKPESSITGGRISEQNIFACNSSVGSSNSSRMMSMQNNIDRFEDMFYQKQRIFDKKIIKIIVIVLILCGIGLSMSSYKISLNSKGFLQMQEILFADGACSDNLQLSMFMYNRGLSINRKLQEYIKTQNEAQYKILKSQINSQQYEQKYLHRLVVAQIQNMNKYLTSLSNIIMYKYQKQLVTWLDDVAQSVTTTRFMLNYVYLSNQVALLSQNISKLIRTNATKQQISSTKRILQINLKKMKRNFPELQRLNSVNLVYYKNIFLQTQQKMVMVSYIKISITMITVIVILSIIQQHYYFRAKQVEGIYSEYKKFPEESVLALIRYFIDFRYYLKQKSKRRHDGIILTRDQITITSSSSNNSLQLQIYKDSELEKLQKSLKKVDFKQMDKQNERQTEKKFPQLGIRKLQDHREDIQLKLLKINTIFQTCSADLLTKTQSTIKKVTLTIHQNKISLSTIICILTIVLILSINIIMFRTEKGIMQTAQEIVTNINDLMDSQNIVISAYFQLKGTYTTTPILTKPQSQTLLNNLLERINKTQVTFNKIAANSLYLFKLYDPTYPQKMIATLTSNICQLLEGELPEQFYKKCVSDYQMRMLQYGIMNSMNFFTRKIINNMYELIDITSNTTNSTSIIKASTISEVDKTIIYMFKIYQETQAQITSSFIVAIDNLILQNLLVISVEYLFFIGVIIFVIVFYRSEEKNHINRIGRILLIPIKILQANRQIMRNFQKVIDYDDIK